MWGWAKAYHSYLVKRGEASEDHLRFLGVQRIAFPWFLAMFVGVLLMALFSPPDAIRIGICLVIGVPCVAAMIYAMTTYALAAFAADRQRTRDKAPL